MTYAADVLMEARRAINGGDPRTAYLLATNALMSEPGRVDLHLAAAESLHWLGQADFARVYELAAAHPRDRDAVLGLAQFILARGDAPLAVSIAGRAVELQPHFPASLALLALAWAADFQPANGLPALRHRTGLEFDPAFVRAWCALLCGEIESVLRFVEGARAALRDSALDRETWSFREGWLHYLEHCVARRVTLGEPSDILRAWHFVQYGSVILDCCEDLEPGGGRFTATWKSYGEVTAILKALFDLLIRTGRRPLVVVAAPGRDSAILGRAAAQFLDVPFHSSVDGHTDRAGALIVAAHASDLDALPVSDGRDGETVFAMEVSWLAVGHVVPDVCGMLSLSCTLPWHVETALAHHAAGSRPSGLPSEEEVVQRLLAAEGQATVSAGAALPFYAERAADMTGGRAGRRRERFRRDSPVPTLQSWRGYA